MYRIGGSQKGRATSQTGSVEASPSTRIRINAVRTAPLQAPGHTRTENRLPISKREAERILTRMTALKDAFLQSTNQRQRKEIQLEFNQIHMHEVLTRNFNADINAMSIRSAITRLILSMPATTNLPEPTSKQTTNTIVVTDIGDTASVAPSSAFEPAMYHLIEGLAANFASLIGIDNQQARKIYEQALEQMKAHYYNQNIQLPNSLAEIMINMETQLIVHGLYFDKASVSIVPQLNETEIFALPELHMVNLIHHLFTMVAEYLFTQVPAQIPMAKRIYQQAIKHLIARYPNGKNEVPEAMVASFNQVHRFATTLNIDLET